MGRRVLEGLLAKYRAPWPAHDASPKDRAKIDPHSNMRTKAAFLDPVLAKRPLASVIGQTGRVSPHKR